jgi:4-hydroxyacetophenone monooxygenase
MFPNPNYHAAVGPGVKWALRYLPFYGRWYRFLLFWPSCDTGLAAARVDPDWPDQQRAVSQANDLARMMFTDWIKSQLDEDTELLAKVLPDYPATGKRTLQDNGSWLQTLTRDNVELVRDHIDHIEPDCVVAQDGRRFGTDVLIYATGFRVNDMLSSLTVTGRDGVDLHAAWDRRPAAYLGITVPGFPNFFCLYGPGTNLASGGSLIFHSECEARYIMGCIDLLIEGDKRSMEPRQDRYDQWYARCQAELATMVWSQPTITHSYYKNDDGLVHSLSPWRLVDYWTWTRTPDPDHFVLR